VGTPGRVMDLALDNYLRFDQTQKLVIDEFDEMLGLGFRPQLTAILAMMRAKRQNILFSATMTEEVDEILEEFFDFPEEITLAASGTPLEQIAQQYYRIPNFNTKTNLLERLLDDTAMQRVLVFVNNKRIADLLFEKMEERLPGQFGVLHSNKSQNYRLNAISEFQNGGLRGLVTTDIMARGLDIRDISHVVNFDMPEIPEQYIHRIGRTGRADASGTAISFVAAKEEDHLVAAEILMEREVNELEIPAGVEISKQLIGAEKEAEKVKMLLKRPKPSSGVAFKEKSAKNKKVNLGGPGKTKKKTGSVNRNLLRQQAAKKKRK
jgi:ATP-dependent RNA helicase RhlE